MSTYFHGILNVKVNEGKDLPNADKSFFSFGSKDVSDPYVTVDIGSTRVIKTAIIDNNLNPKWYESFQIYVAHYADEIQFRVKDKDFVGVDLLGVLKLKAEKVASGEVIKGWFNLVGGKCKPNRSSINIEVHYICDAELERSMEVPDCYFPLRSDCKVTLYQDAHTPLSEMHNSIYLANGETYQPACAWRDIYEAISNAQHFIYMTGWSVFTTISLLREEDDDKTSLGEMIMQKASEGVRVLIMVWNEMLSTGVTDGLMGTHDEDTLKYFHGSDVHVVLTPRQKDQGKHMLESNYVSTCYSHHQKTVITDAADPNDEAMRRIIAFVGGLDLTDGRWDTPEHSLFGTLGSYHANDFYQKSAKVNSACGPREPWHDIHSRIEGPAVLDVLANFQERWRKQASKLEHRLLDMSLDVYNLDCPGSCEADERWKVQLFRSITSDSAVFDPERVNNLNSKKGRPTDDSIHRAYVHCIRRANNYLYIENQYFLGSAHAWGKSEASANHLVPLEIAQKICKKIDEGERFSAYIVVPMFPEGDPASGAVQEILHWQHMTIEMMYKKIARAIEANGLENHPCDFLSFFCLGKREEEVPEDLAPPEPDSQEEVLRNRLRFMIYVHSKMMIVDDEYIIVGSANINQRSMGGNRDTEIAIGSYQTEQTFENCGGLPRGQVHGFRMSLWAEHMGSVDEMLLEPGSLECMQMVNEIAQSNLDLYLADDPCALQGYLLKYPMQVDQVGKVSAYPGCENIPDTSAPVLGSKSGFLPSNLTT